MKVSKTKMCSNNSYTADSTQQSNPFLISTSEYQKLIDTVIKLSMKYREQDSNSRVVQCNSKNLEILTRYNNYLMKYKQISHTDYLDANVLRSLYAMFYDDFLFYLRENREHDRKINNNYICNVIALLNKL